MLLFGVSASILLFFSWVNMLSAVNWYRYSSTRPGTHFMVVAEASTLQTAVAFFAGDTHFSFCRVHSSSIRMCVYATSFVPGTRYWYILPVVCNTPRHMNRIITGHLLGGVRAINYESITSKEVFCRMKYYIISRFQIKQSHTAVNYVKLQVTKSQIPKPLQPHDGNGRTTTLLHLLET